MLRGAGYNRFRKHVHFDSIIRYDNSLFVFNPTINDDNTTEEDDDNNMNQKILHIRYKCGVLVKHRLTQKIIIILLLVYAMLLGVATYPFISNNSKAVRVFTKMELSILIIFTIELLMQFVYRGYKLFIKKGILLFDLVLIVLSWIVTPIPLWRTLRILQTFRLVGRLTSMREVVKALVYGFKMLCAILFLLIVIFYIFSVLFTSIYKDMYALGHTQINYFGSLGKTAFTLYQIMCLDDWSEIVREVMVTCQYAWIYFMSFIIIAAFIVMESVLGVFCMGLHEIKGVSFTNNDDTNDDTNDNTNNVIQEDDYDALLYQLDTAQRLITNISTSQQKSLYTLNSYLLKKFNIDIYDIKSRHDIKSRQRKKNSFKGNNNNNNNAISESDRNELNRGLSFRSFRRYDIYEASWNHLRHICQIITDNKIYQTFMISLIILNAAMLGLNTYKVLRTNQQFATVFNYIDTSFMTFFTIEIIIKLLSHGISACFKDYWFILDFFVTLLSWGFQEMQILRSLKIIRLLTLISRIKSLRDVVKALYSCLPKLFSLFALLLCVFYIFSVLFTSIYKDMYKLGQTEIDYFGSLSKSAFTLFQIMCLDDWSEIAREVMVTYQYAWTHFMGFIILTALLILKMMISLLCDAVCVIRQQEYYDLLEENNLDYHGDAGDHAKSNCFSINNICTQVDVIYGTIDDIQKSQKKMNEYVQSLSKHLSTLSSSSIARPRKNMIRNSSNYKSLTGYEISPDDENTNGIIRDLWESNTFTTALNDTFGTIDEESYYDIFDNVNDNDVHSTSKITKSHDTIGMVFNATYEILNDDRHNNINRSVCSSSIMLSHGHGIDVITEDICEDLIHDTSMTDCNGSIGLITDAKYETNALNHDSSLPVFDDSTGIITDTTYKIVNNEVDEENSNNEITTTLDDTHNENNIEKMVSSSVNGINYFVNKSMIKHFCMPLQCSSSSYVSHDDNSCNNDSSDEQYGQQDQEDRNSVASQSITQYDCVPMQLSNSTDSNLHQVREEDVPNTDDPMKNGNTDANQENHDCHAIR